MIGQFKSAVSLLTLSLALFNSANAGFSPVGCTVDESTGSYGATVKFYEYDPSDTASYNDNDFLSSGYLHNKYVGKVNDLAAVQEIRWSSGLNLENPPFGFTGVPADHFVVEITGYYFATQSGVHNANLKHDGAAALFMGSGFAFDCCGQPGGMIANNPIYTSAFNQSNVPKEFYLEKETHYPFKLVYVNNEGTGAFELEINRPDGSVDLTVGNNIYGFEQSEEASNCNALTYTHEFTTNLKTVATTTVTYTTSAVTALTTVSSGLTSWTNDDNGEVTVVYVVEVPVPVPRTSYTTGSVTKATTISTITTFTTGTDGNTTPDTIVVIETPPPATHTSYITDHVTQATTYTISTYIIGPDGERIPEYIVVIATPPPSSATSQTSVPLTDITSSTKINTTPATTDAVKTSSTEAMTSNVESTISSSSRMYYGNSTSQQLSSSLTSNEASSQKTALTSVPATNSAASPDNTQTVSNNKPSSPATHPTTSPDTTHTVPSNKPTAPADNDSNTSGSGNDGSSNNGKGDSSNNGKDGSSNNGNDDSKGSSNHGNGSNASDSGNEGSSNNGNNGNVSGSDNEGSANIGNNNNASGSNNDSSSNNSNSGSESAPSGEGSSNNGNVSAPGSEGSSNNGNNGNMSGSGNEGSSNNDNDAADKNGMPAAVTTVKPYSSPTHAITPSVSTYEGAATLNKKWSLTSLLAVALLVIA